MVASSKTVGASSAAAAGEKRANVGVALGASDADGRGGKRARTVAEAPRVDASLITSVVDALDDAASLSDTGREMLRRMAPGSLTSPVERRHEFQTVVADMLREVFSGVVEGLQAEEQALAAKVEEAASARETRQQEVQERKRAATEHTSSVEAAQQAVSNHTAALSSAKQQRDEKHATSSAEKAKFAGAAALREALQAMLKDHWQPFMEGTDGKAEEHSLAVAPLLRTLKVDDGLVSAFVGVGRKQPEARKPFDLAVIKNMDEELQKQAERLESAAAEEEKGLEEVSAAMAGAEEALKQAKLQVATSAAALRAVECEAWEVQGALAFAEEALREADGQFAAARAGRKAREQSQEAFRSGPLFSLEALCSPNGAGKEVPPQKLDATPKGSGNAGTSEVASLNGLPYGAVPTPVRASSLH